MSYSVIHNIYSFKGIWWAVKHDYDIPQVPTTGKYSYKVHSATCNSSERLRRVPATNKQLKKKFIMY